MAHPLRCSVAGDAAHSPEYEVTYSIPHSEDAPLSLTFIVTGDDADTILIQGRQRSTAGEVNAAPGQLDQRVYRLDRLNELKEAQYPAGRQSNGPGDQRARSRSRLCRQRSSRNSSL